MPDEAPEKPEQSGEGAPTSGAAVSDTRASEPPADAASPSEGPPAGESGDAETAAPKRRKKRKKRAPEPEASPAEPKPPALTPDGRERPLFVLGFPEDPELDRLVHAFEAGNYAFVREHAPKLAERTSSPRVRDAARELARRIEPDPLIKVLLGLSVALFLVLAFWAYKTHGG
jgi:hypothetical protein